MKVMCINGSPRRNGSCVILLEAILDGMRVALDTVTFCHLGEKDIRYCSGCKVCYCVGTCPQTDDVAAILASLAEADLIIVASPSYWGDVTGQLKVFFDRNTPYADTNPHLDRMKIPPGKFGVSVAVRAGQTERENLHILETIEHYFGHLGITPKGRLSVTAVDTVEDLSCKPEAVEKARILGASLRESVDIHPVSHYADHR